MTAHISLSAKRLAVARANLHLAGQKFGAVANNSGRDPARYDQLARGLEVAARAFTEASNEFGEEQRIAADLDSARLEDLQS